MTRIEPPAARGASLSARGLGKSFGAASILRDISIDIAPGAFVGVVGKSGCGKSTLLRLLVGLEAPTTGAVEGLERATSRLVFQEPRLLPWATVAQNVAIGLNGSADSAEAVAAALRDVGLDGRGGEWPARLSGGQKQRVALARALVSRPRLLALDEPLGALDALTRIEMQTLLEQVWARQGFTALLVTHDVAEAVALCDRLLVIEEGGVALDIPIDLPRRRRRGDPAFAAIEGRVLDRLFGGAARPGGESAIRTTSEPP